MFLLMMLLDGKISAIKLWKTKENIKDISFINWLDNYQNYKIHKLNNIKLFSIKKIKHLKIAINFNYLLLEYHTKSIKFR